MGQRVGKQMRLTRMCVRRERGGLLKALVASGWTLLLISCRVPPIATQSTPSIGNAGLAGTYRLEICRGACGRAGAQLLAGGTLVVEDTSYTTANISPAAREYFETWTALLLGIGARERPNACFVLSRAARDGHSYAGFTKVGLTRLEVHRGDSLRIALYQSPDASYLAILHPADGLLSGRGRSDGYADAADEFEMDSVRARRIGAPDRGICVRAAETAAAELAARRRPAQP